MSRLKFLKEVFELRNQQALKNKLANAHVICQQSAFKQLRRA
ncbi:MULTISPECIES: hypothetical protein [Thiomicrorhabdus]|nr:MULTISPECIES: hypothetical protein [Thiomicrorhabdus]